MRTIVLLAVLFVVGCTRPAADASSSSVAIDAEVIGPLTKSADLQIVTVFPYEAGETSLSPATELLGFIRREREQAGFGATALATYEPVPSPVAARRLVYIALGPRSELSLSRLEDVGRVAFRVTEDRRARTLSFAPILRDQNVASISAGDVAHAFVSGFLSAYERQRRAQGGAAPAVREVTCDAGPKYIDETRASVARAVAEAAKERR